MQKKYKLSFQSHTQGSFGFLFVFPEDTIINITHRREEEGGRLHGMDTHGQLNKQLIIYVQDYAYFYKAKETRPMQRHCLATSKSLQKQHDKIIALIIFIYEITSHNNKAF